MAYTWRTTELPKAIEDKYIQKPQEEWFDITISASGFLNVTVVSNQFLGIPLQIRKEQFEHLLQDVEVPLSVGFLSLYTVEEAKTLELSKPASDSNTPIYSWFDLAQQAANPSDTPRISKRVPRIPRTIAFYSFKGGVGRTTALAHVATILALQGHKVVVVDLDLEAPGLSSALNLTPLPQHGIVDYFYERSYLPKDVEPSISVSEIFGEVPVLNASGRLFVVPAGKLDLGYIAKSGDLRAVAITERGEDLWTTFYQDITEQLQPDVILVDSRTGFNEWGAFSLLRAADKAIIFLYPNEQNSTGIRLLIQTLEQRVPYYFVFSMVPAVKDVGPAMVEEQWKNLQVGRSPNLQSDVTSIKNANRIIVPYLTAIALATSYPVHELLSYYQPIADIVYEDTNEVNLRHLLADQEQRIALLQSLTFLDSHGDEKEHGDFYFQRTANFDKLLDENVSLVLGHKGTGKSTLCTLLLTHKDEANHLAYGRLRNVTCISGCEVLQPYLTAEVLQNISQAIEQSGRTWEDFWGLLLFYHSLHTNSLPTSMHIDLSALSELLVDGKIASTDISATFKQWLNSNIKVRESLEKLNEYARQEARTFWFLYDDIQKNVIGEIREKVLEGLFQLIQNSAPLKYIKCKVFLAEDVWSELSFDKKYFNGRSFNLFWTDTDFLRLALHQTYKSKRFRDIADKFSPIVDEAQVAQASREELDETLQLLWGSRREFDTQSERVSYWLYRNLTDASGTTFPGLINTLLQNAVQAELQADKSQHLPTDRLLSSQSLQEGLIAAIQERCNDMRQTYPQFQPFFDALAQKGEWLKATDLQRLWHDTVQDIMPELKDFTQFVNYLRSLGLVGAYEEPEGDVIYLFPDMYVTGFKMGAHPF